jgi:hypothetical protein
VNFEKTCLLAAAPFDELAGRLQLACLQIAKHPRTFHTQKHTAVRMLSLSPAEQAALEPLGDREKPAVHRP